MRPDKENAIRCKETVLFNIVKDAGPYRRLIRDSYYLNRENYIKNYLLYRCLKEDKELCVKERVVMDKVWFSKEYIEFTDNEKSVFNARMLELRTFSEIGKLYGITDSKARNLFESYVKKFKKAYDNMYLNER